MSEHDELLAAFQRVCLAESVDPADVARLEANGGGPSGRFSLYRDLVRVRLRDLVAAAYPRTARAIGRAAMDGLADTHITAGPLDTRFFREHAERFGSWAIDRLEKMPLGPPWSRDLLRLETAQWQANYRPSPRPAVITDFDLELVPIASATLRLLTTAWSVHTSGDGEPTPGAFHLAVYRRPDHRVETRWMEPIWSTLIADMARGERPAIDSVRAALVAHARAADAAFVDEMTTFVSLLVDNGALLGSVPGET
jgi:hypothetical protein